jgi:hypothetical protein
MTNLELLQMFLQRHPRNYAGFVLGLAPRRLSSMLHGQRPVPDEVVEHIRTHDAQCTKQPGEYLQRERRTRV